MSQKNKNDLGGEEIINDPIQREILLDELMSIVREVFKESEKSLNAWGEKYYIIYQDGIADYIFEMGERSRGSAKEYILNLLRRHEDFTLDINGDNRRIKYRDVLEKLKEKISDLKKQLVIYEKKARRSKSYKVRAELIREELEKLEKLLDIIG